LYLNITVTTIELLEKLFTAVENNTALGANTIPLSHANRNDYDYRTICMSDNGIRLISILFPKLEQLHTNAFDLDNV
jgi:hypothetical protein